MSEDLLSEGRRLLDGREILIVEDEVMLRKRLAAFLERAGAEVVQAGTVAQAKNALKEWQFDFALIDIQLPDGEGLDLLKENAFGETTAVIVMTSEGGVARAVSAMKLGARDFLAKPFDEEELPLRFLRCQRQGQEGRAREFQRRTVDAPEEGLFFGGALERVRAQLERIIETDRRLGADLPPVLLWGATGTGKTSLARWIHQHGPRARRELVEVNCSTLPESLAESELFGHERGAFTDARQARIGLFEAAHEGTLFLDEVPSLSLANQSKLLTAIEDRKVRRVGGNKDIKVDARLIAATNANLPKLVAEGKFREDLYHRLDLLTIRVPSLAERGDDVVRLANHLLGKLSKKYRLPFVGVPRDQEKFLLAHRWPGNVRELSHELERQLVWGGELDFSHLGRAKRAASTTTEGADWLQEGWRFPPEGFDLEQAIDRLVELALDQAGGNVSAAARLLGVKRDYVRYRLKQKSGEDGEG